jgi:hypothetical protein
MRSSETVAPIDMQLWEGLLWADLIFGLLGNRVKGLPISLLRRWATGSREEGGSRTVDTCSDVAEPVNLEDVAIRELQEADLCRTTTTYHLA